MFRNGQYTVQVNESLAGDILITGTSILAIKQKTV